MIAAALRLMRPANVVTAYGDIVAGYAAAAVIAPGCLIALLAATTGLYAGGVMLNDVFDAKLDAIERPERPIPGGAICRRTAAWLGAVLLAGGVGAGFSCSLTGGLIALATALAVVTYDSIGKHHAILGPFNMGLCRGLNLLLGFSLGFSTQPARLPVGLVTLCYIAGVTVLSRGEVKGGTRTAAVFSASWLACSVLVLTYLGVTNSHGMLFAAPFLVLLIFRVMSPFARAFATLEPKNIRLAVKTGVLSLILLDASLAALFGGPWYGLAVLALYVPAMLLAKLYAVT